MALEEENDLWLRALIQYVSESNILWERKMG